MKPLSLEKRQTMQAAGDRTVNAVGPENCLPVSEIKEDGTVRLIDSFVRDGWVLPENRDAEIIAALQKLRVVEGRQYRKAMDKIILLETKLAAKEETE